MNKTTVSIFFFSLVLILSTSFQNDKNEMVRIESEYMIPGLIQDLKRSFSDTANLIPSYGLGENLAMYPQVRNYFILRSFRPAWTSFSQLNEHGIELVALLGQAREYGLETDHYHMVAVRQMMKQLRNDTKHSMHRQIREKIEILLTDAALKFMVNLHSGYITSDTSLSGEWIEKLPRILVEGIEKNKLIQDILSVQPRFIEYTRLQRATGIFVRQTELTDEWQKIMDPGEDTARFIKQVKQILIKLGYVTENSHDSEILAGLKEFQRHHGFEADGKPGKNTLEALSLSSLYHYRMLALNLDRLRKQDNAKAHLFYVNIPAYQLKIFRENRFQQVYRVIVGNPETPTPQLTSRIERIVANPVWNVPLSIIQKELLPRIKADTGYLTRNRFKLINKQNVAVSFESIDPDMISDAVQGYTLQQDASSDNALGRVKFIFSNPYAVYLHDTPGKTLFSKDIRALSHGCIRVQDAEKLADYMVKIIQSDSTDICGLIENGIRRDISLRNPIPIHISYITCGTDEKGDLYFYKDIYGIDQKELAELAPLMGI